MTAEQFIAELEKQGLLPGNVISMLRRMVEDAPTEPPPSALAKILVDHGQLTPFQAKKFLGEAEAKHRPTKQTDQPVAKTLAPPKKASDDLGLTPLDDDGGLTPLDDASGLTPLSDDLGLTPLDDDKPAAKPTPKQAAPAKTAPSKQPAPAAKASAPAAKTPASKTAAKAPAADASGLTPLGPGDGLTPLDDLVGKPAPSKPAAPASSGAKAGAPLDDLLGDPLLSSSAATAGSPLLPSNKPKGFFESLFGGGGSAAPTAKGPTNPWESPLILIGGGGLILLCIVGVVLFFFITRGSAQEAFDAAEKDYSDGAYGQAIAKYERFLTSFSTDSHASLARVRIGVAQLRTIVSSKNWPESLRVAREVLPPLEQEDAFAEARPELVTLLPDIFAGFVEQAAGMVSQATGTTDLAPAKELVTQAREAEKLAENPVYLPTSERKSADARIVQIRGQLEEVEHFLLRDKELKDALTNIAAAVAAGETAKAYEIRRTLLRNHPILVRDPGLLQAVLQISAKEREKVVPIAEPLVASTEDAPQAAATRVIISSRSGEAIASANGYVVPVLAAGSVFGIDAGNGTVLWRRPVGIETTIPPRLLFQDKGADVLAVDARRRELLRLASADGKVVWRLELKEEFFPPVIAGDSIYVATRGGRLIVIDPSTGTAKKQARLGQKITAEPALNSTAAKIYVVADHTNLYTLEASSLQCSDVTYLGHTSGAIVAPAAVAVGYVVVPENLGSDITLLRIFTAAESGALLEVVEPLRLAGHVLSAPVVAGKRMVWCTDRGEVQAFEVNPTNAKTPLTSVGKQVGTHSDSVYPYPLLDGTRFWLAGVGITRNELQAARLVRQLAADERDAFDGPLMLAAGEALISVRRRVGLPGITVAATRVAATFDSATETRHAWETHLAVPLAGTPQALAEQRKIIVTTDLGDIFELAAADLQAGRVDRPTQRLGGAAPLRVVGSLDLADSRRLLTTRAVGDAGASGLFRFDPADTASPIKPFAVPKPGPDATSRSARWGAGVIVPLAGGQIAYLNASTGEPLATPYQAPIDLGSPSRWQSIAAPFDTNADFAAVDERGNLHIVGLQPQPSPLLAPRGTKALPLQAGTPVAIAGTTLWTIGGDEKESSLQPYKWPDLTAGDAAKLSGPPTWGPEAVGDVAFVATRTELHCLDAAGKVRWTMSLEHPLAGPVAVVPEGFLVAQSTGVVRLVSADKGEKKEEVDFGEPLASGPALFNGRVLAAAADGTLVMSQWKKP